MLRAGTERFRSCSPITQQDGEEGTDWSAGTRQGGEELRLLRKKEVLSPSLVVVGGVRAESLEGKPSTVPVTGRREEALHLFPEKQ